MKTASYILAAALSVSGIAHAQENATENRMNREMTLEREYNPAVQDANKVNTLPAVKEPEVRKVPVDYTDIAFPVNPPKEFNLFPAGSVMTVPNYDCHRGYLNLAGGTYLNLNGDFGYHLLHTDKDRLNLFLTHRSANETVKYIPHEGDMPVRPEDEKVKAKLNDNLGGFSYRHAFDKAAFKLGARYGYSAFNYYGLPIEPYTWIWGYMPESGTALPVAGDRETNQVNQLFHAYTGIASKEDAPIGYSLDLGFRNFSYKYGIGTIAEGTAERTFDAKFDLNVALANGQRLGAAGHINYFNYTLPPKIETPYSWYNSLFENYMEMTLSPYYKIEGGDWHVNLGINVIFFTGADKKTLLTPNIFADVKVADKTVLYAEATGSLQSNSLYDVSRLNRYISPTAAIAPSRHHLDAEAGVKSGILPDFWFDLFGGYKLTSNDFFFIPNRTMPAEGNFNSRYGTMSDMDTKRLFAGARLKYNYLQLFELSLKGILNQWTAKLGKNWVGGSADEEFNAYDRPKAEVTANLTASPADKITLSLDYYLAGGLYTRLFGANDVKLKDINELNLTASYGINDTFAAYVKLNNLLFQRYELRYGYPAQGFNAMVGVNLNF
ncbi:Outer membrane cobalamin receptor protein, SusC/RagA family [Bacteroidales bacterium Barb6XT]|nr:Outer membrane cobalamin receptor protein, SusC/RagA family [Bacteroidales bacterium Barb6XT]